MSSEVPEGWREATLGDVIRLEYGRALSAATREPGEIPVYGSNGVCGMHSVPLVPERGIVVGRKGTAGSITVTSGPFWPIDTAYFVVPRIEVDFDWLASTLAHARLSGLSEATGVPGLNRDKAYLQAILLPPLDQQRRIAEVLRSVDALVASSASVFSQARSVLNVARTEVASSNFVGRRLGDVCHVVGGYAFKSEAFSDEGIKVLRISNITESGVQFGERAAHVGEDDLRGLDRFLLQFDDALIALSGATTGKMCVFKCDEIVYVNQRVGYVRVKDKTKISQSYVNHIIASLVDNIRFSAYGGAQPNISTKEISDIVIPMPTFLEQISVAEVLDKTESAMVTGGAAWEAVSGIKKRIASDLLTGRVRVPA